MSCSTIGWETSCTKALAAGAARLPCSVARLINAPRDIAMAAKSKNSSYRKKATRTVLARCESLFGRNGCISANVFSLSSGKKRGNCEA